MNDTPRSRVFEQGPVPSIPTVEISDVITRSTTLAKAIPIAFTAPELQTVLTNFRTLIQVNDIPASKLEHALEIWIRSGIQRSDFERVKRIVLNRINAVPTLSTNARLIGIIINLFNEIESCVIESPEKIIEDQIQEVLLDEEMVLSTASKDMKGNLRVQLLHDLKPQWQEFFYHVSLPINVIDELTVVAEFIQNSVDISDPTVRSTYERVVSAEDYVYSSVINLMIWSKVFDEYHSKYDADFVPITQFYRDKNITFKIFGQTIGADHSLFGLFCFLRQIQSIGKDASFLAFHEDENRDKFKAFVTQYYKTVQGISSYFLLHPTSRHTLALCYLTQVRLEEFDYVDSQEHGLHIFSDTLIESVPLGIDNHPSYTIIEYLKNPHLSIQEIMAIAEQLKRITGTNLRSEDVDIMLEIDTNMAMEPAQYPTSAHLREINPHQITYVVASNSGTKKPFTGDEGTGGDEGADESSLSYAEGSLRHRAHRVVAPAFLHLHQLTQVINEALIESSFEGFKIFVLNYFGDSVPDEEDLKDLQEMAYATKVQLLTEKTYHQLHAFYRFAAAFYDNEISDDGEPCTALALLDSEQPFSFPEIDITNFQGNHSFLEDEIIDQWLLRMRR
jgi:hypothetical protein